MPYSTSRHDPHHRLPPRGRRGDDGGGDGKLTGVPGVAFVTRAPGATNAASGVYVAHHDATPMVLLVGLSNRARRPRRLPGDRPRSACSARFANWVGIVREAERIPEYVARAFQAARSGRPGPVVLGLPEDVLSPSADVADAGAGARCLRRSPRPAT